MSSNNEGSDALGDTNNGMKTVDRGSSDGTAASATPVHDELGNTTLASKDLSTTDDPEKAAETAATPITAPAVNEPKMAFSHREVQLIFVAMALSIFLASLDGTIVATALPTIVTDLGGLSLYAWVGIIYSLVSTSFQPVYGKISDIFGRRNTMLFSIAVFTAGSAICGASVNMAMLIAARGIQGLGAGGLFACVYIIVSDVVNLRDRGKYQGYIGSMWGLATIVGPLLGGVFTDKASWRWAFYINIPFAIIAATIVFIYVKLPPSTKTYKEAIGRIDFVGMIAIIGSSAFILLALELGGREGWGSPMVISFFVIGPVLAGIFVFWENKYAKEPVIAMQLFKIPNFSFAMITAFLINIPFYATGMYLPLFFQVVSGYSAIQSGLMTLPNMLSSVFAVITSGILVSKYGRYVEFTKVGCLLVTIAMPVMAIWNQYTNLGVEIVSMLINGVGLGLTLQTLVMVVQCAVQPKDIASGTSAIAFIRSLGGVTGLAIFGAVLNQVVAADLHAAFPEGWPAEYNPYADVSKISTWPPQYRDPTVAAYVHALSISFWIATGVSALAFGFSLFIRHIPLRTTLDNPQAKAAAEKAAAEKAAKEAEKNGSAAVGTEMMTSTATADPSDRVVEIEDDDKNLKS